MSLFVDFPEILAHSVSLAPLTWFRLGGSAEYFARPQSPEQLRDLVNTTIKQGLPWRVFAGGSNLLIREQELSGLTIHLESPFFSDIQIEGNTIQAGSAVPLTALVSQAARAGLTGLEALTGIPGTLGGAVRGNSGGRQASIGQFVRRATVLDSSGSISVRERDEILFGYRTSNLDDCVILSVTIELDDDDPETVVRQMRRVWIVKKENQPYGYQSCGCIFKNPTPELSAGSLIDQAGLRGKRLGGAEISDRHANYIVAEPGATVHDVLSLIDLMRDEVLRRFGYELELQIGIW